MYNKLTLQHSEIPNILADIPNPPKQLFVVGDSLETILTKPRVAIVGSRRVSLYGKAVTQKLATGLAQQGVVIVSGLAYGVDALAHQAALDAGGMTVAVLPTSLDNIYPSGHRQLADKIVKAGGLLITEYADGTESFKGNFVQRNRLISGISDAVLIPEAAEKSGSLHTARFAIKQGKLLFAVPGQITSPLSGGTNALIKNGARLVTELGDILGALQLSGGQTSLRITSTDPHQQILLDLLGQGISDSQELVAKSGLTPSQFAQSLTMLELSGSIHSLGNNHWTLRA